jgi:hypothetical protein
MKDRTYNILSDEDDQYLLSPSNGRLDDSLPKTIYKYRDLDNCWHKRLISHQEIYFPSPLELNDPFDCRFSFDFKDISHKEILDIHKSDFKKLYPDWTDSKIELESLKRSAPIISGDKDYIQFFSEQNMRNFFKNIGVASFSKKSDDILMWSHYAKNHSGICVGFDTQQMYRTLKATICKVNYVLEYPKILPPWRVKDKSDNVMFSHFLKIFTSKSKMWKYEKEYRIIIADTASQSITLPKSTFKEIIIGSEFPKDKLDSFISTLKKEYPTIQIQLARKSTDNYKLDIYKIK